MRKIILLGAVGLIVVIGAIGGFQTIQHQKKVQSEQASLKYDEVLKAVREKNTEKALSEAATLIQTYPKTPYAQLAAFMSARLSIDNNNLKEAKTQLKAALQGKGPLPHIARIRLAKVLGASGQWSEALETLLAVTPPAGFETLYEEAKGDVYVAMKDFEKARIAYRAAVKAAPPGVPIPWLTLKQTDISDKPVVTEQESL